MLIAPATKNNREREIDIACIIISNYERVTLISCFSCRVKILQKTHPKHFFWFYHLCRLRQDG